MEINWKYLILFLLVLCWSINPFCKKKASVNINSYDYLIINFLINCVIFVIIWLYLLSSKRTHLHIFNKLSSVELIWAIWGSILTMISAFLLIILIKNYEVSHILPQVNPCVILLTFFIGIMLFNEQFDYKKMLGILLIIGGLIFINS